MVLCGPSSDEHPHLYRIKALSRVTSSELSIVTFLVPLTCVCPSLTYIYNALLTLVSLSAVSVKLAICVSRLRVSTSAGYLSRNLLIRHTIYSHIFLWQCIAAFRCSAASRSLGHLDIAYIYKLAFIETISHKCGVYPLVDLPRSLTPLSHDTILIVALSRYGTYTR